MALAHMGLQPHRTTAESWTLGFMLGLSGRGVLYHKNPPRLHCLPPPSSLLYQTEASAAAYTGYVLKGERQP